MHTEGREGELLIALAQTRNELARAEASTREWLSVVEKLRENLNATLLERDDLKESLAAARRDLVRQQELNAELHKGVCSGYAAPLSQMDRIGNAIVGAKAGHHDGAEVVAAVLNLASPAAGDSK